jgi:UDP-N-acetylglucosamine--N-acetylmuramyl-(pentapeptide) pyrophosphoryl-undecaprenol N-acetylglucosamine transferase
MRAVGNLLRATFQARKALQEGRPDVVFSTGGYSSAPVVRAALMLNIPFVLHEQNAVPGRSNLLSAKRAHTIATTFHAAAKHFEGCRVERTGLPVRSELRDIALSKSLSMDAFPMQILVVGGSQGAAAINEAALQTATRMTGDLRWLHVTGKAHFEPLFASYEKLGLGAVYRPKAYLESAEMAEAYSDAAVVVGRSGAGTLSELAAFGIPSVLIPYPQAHANHQAENAKEFADMGAATVINQPDLQAARLEEALQLWITSATARDNAREALRTWDQPDAAKQILEILVKANNKAP